MAATKITTKLLFSTCIVLHYLFHYFRSHPARCANKCVTDTVSWHIFSRSKPCWDTKVSDHYWAIVAEQNVTSLDISASIQVYCLPISSRYHSTHNYALQTAKLNNSLPTYVHTVQIATVFVIFVHFTEYSLLYTCMIILYMICFTLPRKSVSLCQTRCSDSAHLVCISSSLAPSITPSMMFLWILSFTDFWFPQKCLHGLELEPAFLLLKFNRRLL